MKKFSLYVVIGLLCSCLGVRAEKKTGSCGTNLTWTLDTETMALTISGTGTMKEFENLSPWDEYCESNSTFPKSLTIEDGVTGISRYAFQYCQEVSDLYIPKSLTNISQGAFARSNFQSIIVAEDNPVYDSRENCNAIIHTATNTLHIGSTSTVIPSSVTAIGSQSFMACGNLVSLDIPQTVTSMGDNVFPDCCNLSSIVIPEGVTKIGSMMFYNCTALKSATIPEGVTSIAESAFAFCSSLTSITIPKSVTNLGNSIFEGCIKLSEIWMLPTTPPSFSKSTVFVPSNTKIIVPAASYDAYCNAPYWSGMKSQIVANPSERVITIEAQDAQSALQEALGESDLLSITGLTISGTINSYDFEFLRTKMTKLAHLDLSQASVVYNEHRHYETFNTYDNQFPAYAFYNCSNLASISLPEGVDRISHSAFMGCSNLTSIIIPDNLQYIEPFAFNGCCNLSSIDIPNDVSVISESAFEGCGKLTEIVLPENITFIDKNLFKGCSGLTSILIPSAVTSIRSGAFSGCIELKEITLNNSLTTVEWNVFQNCTSLTSIAIPSSVTSLNWSAFAGCSNLTRIDISDLSKWIAIKFDGLATSYYSLYLNDNLLTDLVIPSGITTIGDNTFACCNSITSVSLPEGITSIGEFAFGAMLGLKAVTIPNTVTNIGKEAFYCCDNLKVINFLSATPPAIFGIQIAPYTTEFVVPASSYDAYCSALNWSSLKERIIKNDTPKRTVYLQAASSKSALQEMIGEENLQYITHLTITGTVNSYDFEVIRKKMPSLTHLDMGKANMTGSTYISWAFESCTNLTSISLPEGLTSIGSHTFNGCTSLTSISLPESITSIGSYAFNGCSNLTDIHLGSIMSWGNIDFWNGPGEAQSHPLRCNSSGKKIYLGDELITDLVIPEGVTAIPDYAFYYCDNITSVSLPEGISIGNHVFSGCDNLTSVSLPEGISIGDYVFSGCDNLTSVSLPESLTNIGKGTFHSCNSLTDINLPENLTCIDEYAFNGCKSLTSVSLPEGVTSIGSYAFVGCSSLKTISLPASLTSIDYHAFYGCDILTDIHITCISSWVNVEFGYSAHPLSINGRVKKMYLGDELITDLVIPEGVTAIPDYAFYYCADIISITIPTGVSSIGSYAFSGCSSLTSISLPESLTSIGSSAFSNCYALGELHLLGTTPPALTSTDFVSTKPIFIVPAKAYDTYCAAPYWADIKDRITTDALCTQSVELTAAKDKSDLQVQIGDDKLRFVTDLAISGTINSYDFMILRNKMPLLRHLDLSQANIVANSYEHYTGYHTEDSIFPAYGLYNCNLITLSFPASIKSIEIQGLSSNDYLRETSIPEGVTSIGSSAFSYCSSLTSISLPESITSIGSSAFLGCTRLTSISLPESLTSIGSYAFNGCSSLTSVKLSPNLKTIGSSAFHSCSKLTEIHIPASVRSIGDNAFYYCSNMEDVYVYIVEPTDIGQNTFAKSGNNFIGTLHAPKVSYWDYYYNTQWSQFLEFAEFDGKYDNFYLEGDKVLDNNTGSIEGEEGKNPDAEMGENSGIIVEDDVNQSLGDVDIEHNGENGGSIIVDGTGDVDFENLNFRISVKGGRWYFFCFPFDVRAEDIRCESGAEWVFRYYDGEERAQNGKGGWKNVTSDSEGNMLKAARGYIFQCSKDDVLVLTAKNGKIKQENKYNELVEHVTENMHDASWNFVGNPYLSYYEVTSEDYSAPITVWDGSKYIAIRPGDDDYQLAPFEAFFVQKPEGVAQVSYNSENQMTYTQASEAAAQARQARAQQAINPNRLLVNITLTDGKETDRARVVFNESAEAGYETECDAAKFGTDGVPQIYTMDSNNVKYAINERPMAQGNVSMGYSVPKQGTYTLAATRMDIAVYLMDNLTGTVHDLAKGGYEFCSEFGTFGSRFTLIVKGDATGIDGVLDADADAPIYNVKGQQVKDMNHSDIYIQNNHKMVKK